MTSFQMMIIKVPLSYIICMPGAGHIILVMYISMYFIPFFLLDTGDFVPDDDYQGITKLHD